MEKCYSDNFSEPYSLTDVSYRVPYLPKSDRKSRDYFDFIAPLSTDPSSKFPFRNNPTHLRLQYLINPRYTLCQSKTPQFESATLNRPLPRVITSMSQGAPSCISLSSDKVKACATQAWPEVQRYAQGLPKPKISALAPFFPTDACAAPINAAVSELTVKIITAWNILSSRLIY